ncbi:MAG: HesA/MoeB/ThiF family protein [Cetobacterium sp.]
MEPRYSRNFESLSLDEQMIIRNQTILVVGAGGLGGLLLDHLARLGVKKIKIIDFDCFDLSNLNRQLLSNENNLGFYKVEEAKKHINLVNSTVQVEIFSERFENCDFKTLFKDVDVVFDCCDNIESKFHIEIQSQLFKIPLIYGAVGGFFGQVGIILPGHPLLNQIYPRTNLKGIESKIGNLCTTVSIVSSLQVSLFLKLILNKTFKLNGFYYIDTLSFELEWIPFSE